ncbi:MAG: Mini-ribonuclease 3 [Bacillota bacterium]|jgi:ribonuclease-3 family protein
MTVQKMMDENPNFMPALTLAYLGDVVYEIEVRKYLVEQGIYKVDDLHKTAVTLVRANTQAEFILEIKDELMSEEESVFRRGRNAKGQHSPKGASVASYKLATGLEALVGYWYLTENQNRLAWFFEKLWQFDKDRQTEEYRRSAD